MIFDMIKVRLHYGAIQFTVFLDRRTAWQLAYRDDNMLWVEVIWS